MQYYITKSNFMRITREFTIEFDQLNNPLYKKVISFLSDVEKNKILSVKQFLIHSKDELIQFKGSGFVPDRYNYVFEKARHAKYHKSIECSSLNSSYNDIEIPVEIKYEAVTGKLDIQRIEQFRAWFKQSDISSLYYNNQKEFIKKLELKFRIRNLPRPIELENGGIKKVSNFSEKELENKIDELIELASSLYAHSDMNREILVKNNFSKRTYYVTSKKYKDVSLYIYGKNYSNDEIRSVLIEFYTKVKKPIIDLLIDYWIIKLNPNLDFNQNILEQMEFEPCKLCGHSRCNYIPQLDILDKDDEWELASVYSKSQQKITNELVSDDLPF